MELLKCKKKEKRMPFEIIETIIIRDRKKQSVINPQK